jgi:glucose/arabinose dehydrogenase
MFMVLAGALAAIACAWPSGASALELPAGFSTVQQVAGLDGPTALAYAPDGRLFIAEKAGRVRVVDASGRLQPDPVIDISDHVNSYWDRGLLGLAVDPDFATNHFVYLLYTYEANPVDPSGAKTSRLTRITVTDANRPAEPSAPETVLVGSIGKAPCPAPADTVDCIPSDGYSHSIGTVRADPDGTLWLGSGDSSGFWGADPKALRTYDEHSFSGKIMHVDRQGHGLPGHPFCPTETDLTKVCTKLHAKGFRNPYRFQLRPGAPPLVGDVGWNTSEELDVAQPGRSYGWPCYEGTTHTPGYEDLAGCAAEYAAGPAAHQPPAYSYAHGADAAVIAGPRYEAAQYPPEYRGQWFFGDYAKGLIWRMTLDEHGAVSGVQQFASGFEGGVDLERAPNGDLVYVNFGTDAGTGSVQRIVYGNRPPVAKASATPTHGVAPLAVNLSADGSADPDGDALTYEWDFESDGSADATGPSVSHTYGSGAHTATLTVRDARGLAVSDTVQVLADESPPTVSMLAPAPGTRYRDGQPLGLEGSGSDAQDGPLGDAALHWRVTLHHADHIHVIEADHPGAAISFTPPRDHDADSFLEIRLTARDSAGLESSVVRTLKPETVGLRLESDPPGARLSYAGVDVSAPVLRTAAIGFHSTVSAPATLEQGGRRFLFDHWSDGGARLHAIDIPDRDLTLTAVYRAEADPTAAAFGSAALGMAALPAPASAPAAPRLVLDGHGHRTLHGRLLGASRPLRVDVALRLRRGARGCRWWHRPLGRLGSAAGKCDRPVWMKTVVDRSGRWRLGLGGRSRRGAYTVLMRARTLAARPRVVARGLSPLGIP